MTHTLETSGIARVVARALQLNEDLTEAIGLGHDLGHPPFGHAGEAALDSLLESGFRHNAQSAKIARRLNLTFEVVDGIRTHTGDDDPETLEGRIVRIVDRVAYINHDIDDAIRYGILEESDLPLAEIETLGPTGAKRIDTLVHDLVETSARAGDIGQSEEIGAAMNSLRAFMFDRVYLAPVTRPEHDRAHATIRRIYEHLAERGDDQEAIVEFIAGMTDRFALSYAATL
jgi:dGTPase